MGVMIVRIINDGPITLPMMRMHPPVPEGWTSDPELIDVPSIAPGGNLPVRFEITADRRYGADEIPLAGSWPSPSAMRCVRVHRVHGACPKPFHGTLGRRPDRPVVPTGLHV